ncbi:hypothetical protein [Algibacter luteus]|uniref:Uncharacterized protein n=1 Tax=Algibacter luteus TaxID=1178825 RepID=A0A1M6HB86_9FLAO|nr:hypothetical protein [Algibacter luteus]SHJ19481.1 hypothetical protein SAMN05216261_3110 [Algibacter luteus]
MKNKSNLKLITFVLTCCICIVVNAQKQNSNNDFTVNVVKSSNESNFEKEHIHVLELKNNSKQLSEYVITMVTNNCSNQKQYDAYNIKSTNKEFTNINTKMFLNDLKGKELTSEVVQVKPNQSIKLYLKTQQNSKAVLDSWNCTKIQATKLSKNQAKGSNSEMSESVMIKTIVRNPNNKGH